MKTLSFFNPGPDKKAVELKVLSPEEISKLRESILQQENSIDTEEEIDSEEEENLIGEGEINKLLENYFPPPGDGYTWLPKGHYKLDGDEAWYPIRSTIRIKDNEIISMKVYWAPATTGTQVMFDRQIRRKIDSAILQSST